MAFDLDEKFVILTEEKLGYSLPDSYRFAMMKNNGGAVIIDGENWQLHSIFDNSDRKRIARTCNDLIRETDSMREWQNWPPNGLSLGSSGFGDALLFLHEGGFCKPQIFR